MNDTDANAIHTDDCLHYSALALAPKPTTYKWPCRACSWITRGAGVLSAQNHRLGQHKKARKGQVVSYRSYSCATSPGSHLTIAEYRNTSLWADEAAGFLLRACAPSYATLARSDAVRGSRSVRGIDRAGVCVGATYCTESPRNNGGKDVQILWPASDLLDQLGEVEGPARSHAAAPGGRSAPQES
jgi:hypothetical protein